VKTLAALTLRQRWRQRRAAVAGASNGWHDWRDAADNDGGMAAGIAATSTAIGVATAYQARRSAGIRRSSLYSAGERRISVNLPRWTRRDWRSIALTASASAIPRCSHMAAAIMTASSRLATAAAAAAGSK